MSFIFGLCAYFSGRREKKKIGGKVCLVFHHLNIITVISGVVNYEILMVAVQTLLITGPSVGACHITPSF